MFIYIFLKNTLLVLFLVAQRMICTMFESSLVPCVCLQIECFSNHESHERCHCIAVMFIPRILNSPTDVFYSYVCTAHNSLAQSQDKNTLNDGYPVGKYRVDVVLTLFYCFSTGISQWVIVVGSFFHRGSKYI